MINKIDNEDGSNFYFLIVEVLSPGVVQDIELRAFSMQSMCSTACELHPNPI